MQQGACGLHGAKVACENCLCSSTYLHTPVVRACDPSHIDTWRNISFIHAQDLQVGVGSEALQAVELELGIEANHAGGREGRRKWKGLRETEREREGEREREW